MSKRNAPIVEQLRSAINKAEAVGDSKYAIAQRGQIERAQLTRLMQGSVAPRLDTAERIAAALGLQITLDAAPAKPVKRPKARKRQGEKR